MVPDGSSNAVAGLEKLVARMRTRVEIRILDADDEIWGMRGVVPLKL